AIKVLLEGAFAGERSRWRFEREVRLLASLDHPNIVTIHDSGVALGRYYLAMALIDGVPLDVHVKSKLVGAMGIIRLVRAVCGAVAQAHQKGIIHRDLKPSNILVAQDGTPYVLDFGLAKLIGEEQPEAYAHLASMTGRLLGTLAYMSPEQLRGKSSDIDV